MSKLLQTTYHGKTLEWPGLQTILRKILDTTGAV